MAMIHNLPSSTDSCSVPLTASQTTAAPLAGTLLTGGVLQLGRYSIPAAIPKPIPMKRPVHHSRGRTPVPASAPMFRKCVRVTNTESTGRRSNPPSFQNHASKNKLGRSYNPGRPLAMEDRQKILRMSQAGVKVSHIAKEIGVTHSCVSKIMSRFRQTGSMHPRSQPATQSSAGTCVNTDIESPREEKNLIYAMQTQNCEEEEQRKRLSYLRLQDHHEDYTSESGTDEEKSDHSASPSSIESMRVPSSAFVPLYQFSGKKPFNNNYTIDNILKKEVPESPDEIHNGSPVRV